MSVQPLFTLLYVSELTVPDAAEIDRICQQSRANNERDDITGLLVFDGHLFCQFVEGAEPVITALAARLQSDLRHARMQILQQGAASSGRRFPDWRLGYAYSADPAAIARVEHERGSAALRAFNRLHRNLPASS